MSNLLEIRNSKHQTINGGTYPLMDNKSVKFSIADIINICGIHAKESLVPEDLYNTLVPCQGRLKTFRKSGAIAFLKIEDMTGVLQLIATKSVLKNFGELVNLDIGDIIECSGQVCRSKAGEKSLLIHSFKLLSKALKPLPEKWEGLSDKNTVYHQRYLDLISNKDSLNKFKMRSATIKAIRSYLDSKGFMEVETPTLMNLNSGANAKPFKTHHNAANTDLYLRIAPELNLKRLIVGGIDRVYEIGKSFRNEGVSSRHNPEFTMLEFYEAYASFKDLIKHTKEIFSTIENIFSNENFSDRFFSSKMIEISMLEAVKNAYKTAYYGTLNDDLTHSIHEMEERPPKYGRFDVQSGLEISEILSSNDSWGIKLNNLFELIAEPFLSEDYKDGDKSAQVMITHHPVEISPLARRSDNDHRVCDRFELYINGIEIANGYQELNDPKDQKMRFEHQLKENNKDPMDYDASYIEALEYGMPPTIGFGLGIDRLLQVFTGSASIKDVILFPAV